MCSLLALTYMVVVTIGDGGELIPCHCGAQRQCYFKSMYICTCTGRALWEFALPTGVLGRNTLMFKAFLSLLFFSMVRVSTFLPDSGCNFDHTRHLTFSDIEFIKGRSATSH